MIAGLGTDLARISRFEKFLLPEKGAVLDRLFTVGELSYCRGFKSPAPHLAARFAAKEALLKAYGLGLRDGLSWHDIEVVRDHLGAPSLRLCGRAAEIATERGIIRAHLSYSHDGDYAVATVILESA